MTFMGKRIKSQRRGKGSNVWKAKLRGLKTEYLSYEEMGKGKIRGQVINLIKENGRQTIMAEILMENKKRQFCVAAEGLKLNQWVEFGENASINIGNVLPLERIPEGSPIFNVEQREGDGGKLVRTSGGYALLLSKDDKYAYIKLPSNETKKISLKCRATIGCASGGERKEKPFVKAGNAYHFKKAKRKKWPITRGVAMNPVSHPFGGSQHHAGKSKSVSRNAPPGRKVGAIASKRTGRLKR